MIYALIATQLLTVVAGLVAIRWALAYLADRDSSTNVLVELNRQEFFKVLTEFEDRMKQAREEAFKEREYLLTRIQHPDQAITQSASIGTETTGISFMDDEEEWKRDHPDLIEEDDDEVVRPLQAIKPFGAEGGGS